MGGSSGAQVIGNKWDTYLSLLQADYGEGYVAVAVLPPRCSKSINLIDAPPSTRFPPPPRSPK
jgi:hypothetical protein